MSNVETGMPASFGASLGTCPTCMSLSGAFFALSLLILGLGVHLDLPLVTLAGDIASAAFALLSALHVGFYLLRRKDSPPPRMVVRRNSTRDCGCSGRRGAR